MQGALTADFLFSIEKKMKSFNERNYMRMLSSENVWWPKLMRLDPFEGKSQRVNFLLDSASIEQLSANDGGESGGSINFDEIQTITTEYFPAYHARGYKIGKLKYLNWLAGSNGQLDPVVKWAGAVGTYGAYYPQRLLAQLIQNGANITGYDGVSFWNTAHPVHPAVPGLGSYANVFTGAASGAYPGACPIDDSVTFDVALVNLSKVLSYIVGSIVQPNGAGDPRLLEPAFLVYPPRMAARVETLLNASFLPVAATGGAGAAQVTEFFRKFRLVEPIMAKELGSAITYTYMGPTGSIVTTSGSDTTYYVVCREAAETELGAFLLNQRLPFTMHTYTGDGGTGGIDAILGRSQDLEWHYDGWLAANVGHPYGIFQCKQT
jgi:hypothetical protein